jgi:hypothetical protein
LLTNKYTWTFQDGGDNTTIVCFSVSSSVDFLINEVVPHAIAQQTETEIWVMRIRKINELLSAAVE